MFYKMKNIDTAFRYIRLFNIAFLSGCVIICTFFIYQMNITLSANRGKVYVLVNGKLIEAVAKDRDYLVEIRDHVKNFSHVVFYALPG